MFVQCRRDGGVINSLLQANGAKFSGGARSTKTKNDETYGDEDDDDEKDDDVS